MLPKEKKNDLPSKNWENSPEKVWYTNHLINSILKQTDDILNILLDTIGLKRKNADNRYQNQTIPNRTVLNSRGLSQGLN